MALELKYFVLNPTKDNPHGEASRKALDEYAETIRRYDPELAKDIEEWVRGIRNQYDMLMIEEKPVTDPAVLLLDELNRSISQTHCDMGGNHRYALSHKSHTIITRIRRFLSGVC